MKDNFNACVRFVLDHEGGYVHHPRDPGGETNFGITKRTADRFYGRDVNMRALTEDQARQIYRQAYWPPFEDLPAGLDLMAFDFGVNAGIVRSQRFVLLRQNVQGLFPNVEESIRKFAGARIDFYRSLKGWPVFGKGWTRRTAECERVALEMAK